MCEFCKYGERNHISDTTPTIDNGITINGTIDFWIQEAKKDFAPDEPILICSIPLNSESNKYITNIIYSGIPIKYCPICGRKLESYE